MIKFRIWVCPHGFEHRVTVMSTPVTGHGESRSPGSVKVTAPRACKHCKVDHRVVIK